MLGTQEEQTETLISELNQGYDSEEKRLKKIRTLQMVKDSRKVKYGIVCILDLLGAKNFDIQNAEEFLDNRDEIINTATENVQKEELAPLNIALEKFTFGDTILFCWDLTGGTGKKMEVTKKLQLCLIRAGHLINQFITLGVSKGLPFRGAISIGSYLSEKSTVIGPAVADAASWYEQADWIGVMATPSAGFHIREFVELGKHLAERDGEESSLMEDQFSKFFVEYEKVPIKKSGASDKMRLWVSSWPFILKRTADDIPAKEFHMFSQFIARMPVPKGTESKYFNTENFFRWYMDEKYPQWEKQKASRKPN